MSECNNKNLIITIIGCSVILLGSVLFFGLEVLKRPVLNEETLKTQIYEGIKAFVLESSREMEQQPDDSLPSEPVDMSSIINKNDPVLGDKNAPVTIVEFSDFQCPYCGIYSKNVYPQIEEEYIKTGKVKYIFKHFPLNGHAEAYPSALATECVRSLAGDEYFYKFHDVLFANQKDLSTDLYEKFVQDEGIKLVLYKECFGTDQFKEDIYADQQTGSSIGVTGTPAFVINGTVMIGAQPYENFKALIDQELNK